MTVDLIDKIKVLDLDSEDLEGSTLSHTVFKLYYESTSVVQLGKRMNADALILKIEVKYSFNKDDRRDKQIHLIVEYLEQGTEQYDNERMYYRVSNVSAQMLVILDRVVSDSEEVNEYE